MEIGNVPNKEFKVDFLLWCSELMVWPVSVEALVQSSVQYSELKDLALLQVWLMSQTPLRFDPWLQELAYAIVTAKKGGGSK